MNELKDLNILVEKCKKLNITQCSMNKNDFMNLVSLLLPYMPFKCEPIGDKYTLFYNGVAFYGKD